METDSTSTATTNNLKEWPGAFGIYKQSKDIVMVNLGTIIGLILISFAASLLLSILIRNRQLQQILSNLVAIILAPAIAVAFLRGLDGQKIELQDSIKEGLSYVINYFLAGILVAFALALSFFALIVPFFFVFPRLMLVPYFVVGKKLGAVDAFKASWEQTKGHSGKVWGIVGVSLLMTLPALTIIGIPVAIYLLFMYSAAYVVFYKYITSIQPQTQK